MNIVEEQLESFLKKGLDELKVNYTSEEVTKLLKFIELIKKWNQTYNLTAIKDPKKIISHHILDSIAINEFIHGTYIIDVGTGAGLPGIPLAIINPDKHFVLLDSLTKRTTFLQQVCYELNLTNVEVVNSRVEDYRPELKFNQIITRAFANLTDMLTATRHLRANNGQFLALKGANFEEELELIGEDYTIVDIHSLHVPALEAQRHLLIIEETQRG